MTQISKQQDFMKAFGMNFPPLPTIDLPSAILWAKLIDEEFAEFNEAWGNYLEDPEENSCADLTAEIADVLYVMMGFAHSQGLPLEAMFSEIHAANMRKVMLDGTVLRNEFGKVLKPHDWYPANKVGVIQRALDKEVYGS